MISRVSQYLEGKKSIGQLAKKYLLTNLAKKEYYETVSLTRKYLLDAISHMEAEIEDGKLNLENITDYLIDIATTINPRLSLFLPFHSCLYALCRIIKPRIVVETGVERGSSTFVILKALQNNGVGELISIEKDGLVKLGRISFPLGLVVTKGIEEGDISDRTLEFWKLWQGNSLDVLPNILDDFRSKVNLFVHGSDHSYEVQKAELLFANEFVPKGGFIVVDRPDYNNFKAVNELYSDKTKYSVTTLAERSIHSPLMFSIVKKLE